VVALGTILSNRYLLQDELGTGGMSTVYRAVDLRTGGMVAVKIPHAFLIRDPQYLQRFTREAQIAATIRSTRIAIVTDVSEHEGTPYIVMECVEGESISDRLTRDGPLPPLEALRIALEIARAIDAAHARGVVHRDLKPQNIRLMPEGEVKVLDFGIARMEGKAALTTASLFLGTPDYAAPERSEGLGDIRSDIYSLGVVLYEMLCGKLPFSGSTPWTVMRMHTAEPPPPLPEDVPPVAREIVERCLAKAPAERYQTPRELVDALQAAIRALDREEIAGAPTTAMPVALGQTEVRRMEDTGADSYQSLAQPLAAAPPDGSASDTRVTALPGRRRPLLPLLAGAAALLLVVALAVFLLTRGGGSGPVTEEETAAVVQGPTLTILQPADGASVAGPVTVQLDVTGVNLKAPVEADPEGRHIHYFLNVDPATVLIPGQPIPTGQANIVHTANASHTFLDLPPGPHTVWAVLTGNDHVPLTPNVQGRVSFTAVPDPLAGARSGDAAPIVYQSLIDGKWRIAVKDGLDGEVRRLTGGNANDFNPALSPDGSRIAFNSDRDGTTHSIYTMNLDGSDIRRITQGGSNDRSPAYSPDGSMIVFQSDREGGREHLWVVPVGGGEARQLTRGPQNDTAPNWSRDGTRIVYQSDAGGGVTHLFVVDARGGTPRQITDGPARDNRPVWSPDGKQIAFARFTNNQWNIHVMNADGSDIRKLTDGSFNINPSWSPDGKQILFQSDRENGQQQVFVMPAEGGTARRVTPLTSINASPSWPMK
jgi:eukaryotic-like serine/threonine-protein kinase